MIAQTNFRAVLEWDGEDGFTTNQVVGLRYLATQMAWGDYDQDGKVDALFSHDVSTRACTTTMAPQLPETPADNALPRTPSATAEWQDVNVDGCLTSRGAPRPPVPSDALWVGLR